MKRAVKIVRIIMCVCVSLYTLYTYLVAGYTARMKCMRIDLGRDGYRLTFDDLNKDAVFYIVFAMLLLLLGVACIILLFRTSRTCGILTGVFAVLSVVLGVCLDTRLAEYTLFRNLLGSLLGRQTAVNISMSIKTILGRLCILTAICYVALLLTALHKQHRNE